MKEDISPTSVTPVTVVYTTASADTLRRGVIAGIVLGLLGGRLPVCFLGYWVGSQTLLRVGWEDLEWTVWDRSGKGKGEG
ncbi:hypothetical protein K504DRAFT_460779 [Pleomassaria siparia CBS 279.74]|uniref:Uncharacterized protein n=1 Tax=Pleomassaria siparia CBS 279.74 TaxID=1314801 RepID=A0A6G1JXC4_9PLEO|nr:hypothetical protein K504DRAFT_460779 [Pleomassaria siparia CBS 279.74]